MKLDLEILEDDSNLKKLIFRCEASEVKRLKRIALETDSTLNALLVEGVKYILNKYEGKNKK